MRNRIIALIGLAALVGCGEESAVAIERNPEDVFWSLRSDIQATTVAVGGTQQLVAQPRTSSNAEMTGLAKPRFRSMDTSKVQVDTNGLVTGKATTTNTLVIASLTVGGLTNADTTIVVVTAGSQTVNTFTVQPLDSTKLGIGAFRSLTARITNNGGTSLFGLAVKYRSMDTTVATISSTGTLQAKSKGKVKIAASTTSYGVSKTDTVEFTITNPATANVTIYGTAFPTLPPMSPVDVVIGRNGVITWNNFSGAATSITFQNDVANVPNGNVASIANFASVTRTFPVAGTYRYTNGLGNSGTVVVLPD